MSQTDIETLKAGFDAYNDGDLERMLGTGDEDIELPGVNISTLRWGLHHPRRRIWRSALRAW